MTSSPDVFTIKYCMPMQAALLAYCTLLVLLTTPWEHRLRTWLRATVSQQHRLLSWACGTQQCSCHNLTSRVPKSYSLERTIVLLTAVRVSIVCPGMARCSFCRNSAGCRSYWAICCEALPADMNLCVEEILGLLHTNVVLDSWYCNTMLLHMHIVCLSISYTLYICSSAGLHLRDCPRCCTFSRLDVAIFFACPSLAFLLLAKAIATEPNGCIFTQLTLFLFHT